MKTSIFTLLTAVMLLTVTNVATAKVWRLNNIPGISADFTSFATAQTVAVAGDTIYAEGSHISYGAITVNKRLTIIGSGYFLTVNDSTQAYPGATQFGDVTFSSGSQGSILTGCQTSTLTINTDDISIIRNYIYETSSSADALEISASRSNILIAQNYIRHSYASSSSTNAFEISSNCSNIVVTNNIILKGSSTTSTTTYPNYAIFMSPTSAATFTNNVIYGQFVAYNSTLQNNIQGNGMVNRSSTYPNTELNNIGHSTQFGALNGNQQLVSMTNVFSFTGTFTEDRYFTLKAGSPALNAGVSGEDCGAFGGTLAYKLSGMPAIPAIFGATVPSSGTTATGINVNIKAKSHK